MMIFENGQWCVGKIMARVTATVTDNLFEWLKIYVVSCSALSVPICTAVSGPVGHTKLA